MAVVKRARFTPVPTVTSSPLAAGDVMTPTSSEHMMSAARILTSSDVLSSNLSKISAPLYMLSLRIV
jgi:hypothetical protein